MVRDGRECEKLEAVTLEYQDDLSSCQVSVLDTKFDPNQNRFELPIVRKLLKTKGKLVAGVGLEPTTLEL